MHRGREQPAEQHRKREGHAGEQHEDAACDPKREADRGGDPQRNAGKGCEPARRCRPYFAVRNRPAHLAGLPVPHFRNVRLSVGPSATNHPESAGNNPDTERERDEQDQTHQAFTAAQEISENDNREHRLVETDEDEGGSAHNSSEPQRSWKASTEGDQRLIGLFDEPRADECPCYPPENSIRLPRVDARTSPEAQQRAQTNHTQSGSHRPNTPLTHAALDSYPSDTRGAQLVGGARMRNRVVLERAAGAGFGS